MKRVVIGSRGSDLALWQANFVKGQLENLGCEVIIKIIKTQGDKIQHLSFDKMEGKGFFTKEIEAALLDKSIDLAVHSHKDLETESPQGLVIACVSERANPSDLLLINKGSIDHGLKWKLKQNATVGTSSARRKSQMLYHRPDVKLADLRGNVPTRIEKLRSGSYDAILLAKAGVDRLNIDLNDFEVQVLDPTEFIPAPAQGVLGLQVRKEDTELAEILNKINAKEVARRIRIERKILNLLDGGCQLPLGAYCDDQDQLHVSLAKENGNHVYSTYNINSSDDIAEKVVADLQSKKLVD